MDWAVASAGSCFAERPDCTGSPQAKTACPAAKTLIAPTWSALFSYPHDTHAKSAWVWRFSRDMWPQHGHVWLVYAAGTATNAPPVHRVLYSRLRTDSPQPLSRMPFF